MNLSKESFCRDYINSRTEQAVAKTTLPDGDRSLAQWRDLWHKQLNKPTK